MTRAKTSAPPKTIFDDAKNIVYGHRQEMYGDTVPCFERVAAFWSILFGTKIKAEQIPQAMILLKMAREMHKHSYENILDICGYAGTRIKMNEELSKVRD